MGPWGNWGQEFVFFYWSKETSAERTREEMKADRLLGPRRMGARGSPGENGKGRFAEKLLPGELRVLVVVRLTKAKLDGSVHVHHGPAEKLENSSGGGINKHQGFRSPVSTKSTN